MHYCSCYLANLCSMQCLLGSKEFPRGRFLGCSISAYTGLVSASGSHVWSWEPHSRARGCLKGRSYALEERHRTAVWTCQLRKTDKWRVSGQLNEVEVQQNTNEGTQQTSEIHCNYCIQNWSWPTMISKVPLNKAKNMPKLHMIRVFFCRERAPKKAHWSLL